LKPAEETLHVGVGGIVIQNLEGDPSEAAVVDDREDAEGAVVQLVGRDVSREVSQHGVEIASADVLLCLFSPGLHPVLDGGVGDEHAMVPP